MKKNSFFMPIILLAFLTSCGPKAGNNDNSVLPDFGSESIEEGSEDIGILVESISLERSDATIEVGESVTLNYSILPANATNKNVYWESSEPKIAKVENGVVTGMSEGNVYVSVTTVDGSHVATCQVYVTKPYVNVAGVELSANKIAVGVGQSEEVTATVLPLDANNKKVDWSSEDPTIASVVDGVIVGLKEGVTNVKAVTAEGAKEAVVEVNVIDYDAHLVAGSAENTASKSFQAKGNGEYVIEKYDEADYAYLKYDNYEGKKWYMEATVLHVVDNVTNADIHNGVSEWWSQPIGVAGVNSHGVYTFGALTYGQFNSYDAIVHLVDSSTGAGKGDYWNLKRNLGGQSISSLADLENGFKVGVLRIDDTYYYFINDVYVGFNQYWVNQFGSDSPALCTYKSGGTFKNVKVLTEDLALGVKTKLDNSLNKLCNDKMFNLKYDNAYDGSRFSSITLDGNICMTNNDEAYNLKCRYGSNKFYFESEFTVMVPHTAWIDDPRYPWVSLGLGHSASLSDGARYLTLGPQNNKYSLTENTRTLAYNADFHEWQYPSVAKQIKNGLTIGNTYKVAILRDDQTVYFFINDFLVHQDGNKYCWEQNSNGVSYPMLGNEWGGTALVSNINLVTDPDLVDEKLLSLVADSEDLKIPEKAKVILIAGQSNAEGHTPYSDLSAEQIEEYDPYSENIQIYYDNCYGGNNSLHRFRSVDYGQARDTGCLGPEVGLAYQLREEDPDTFYYIIKVAEGGSDLYNLWRSPSAGTAGRLYNRLINDIAECEQFFNANDIDYTYEAFCWMQGEADACNKSWADNYYNLTSALYDDLSAALGDRVNEYGLKYLDAAIKGYDSTWQYHKIVNDAKEEFAYVNDNATYIDTNEMGLVTRSADKYHYTGICQIYLGQAFADAYLEYLL